MVNTVKPDVSPLKNTTPAELILLKHTSDIFSVFPSIHVTNKKGGFFCLCFKRISDQKIEKGFPLPRGIHSSLSGEGEEVTSKNGTD